MPEGPDPATPLWRAAQVFRLLSCIYALGFQIAINRDLDRPAIGWLLFAVLIAWSAACAVAYLQGFGRRPAWVLAEIAVVVALVLSTEFVASDQWALDNQSWPTTLWATNATISAAILSGPIAGMLTGVVVMVASTVREGLHQLSTWAATPRSSSSSRWGWRSAWRRRRHGVPTPNSSRRRGWRRRWRSASGCRVRCTTARFRCSRWCPGAAAKSVARQQNWPSWPGSRSARCGGWSAPPTPSRESESMADIGALLRRRASDRVSVSVPADPVLLDANVADELYAAAANALDNVASHAGPDAHAYVLLEDLGDAVTVSIRDDGVGIADGRLEEAVGEGRFGIAKSIVGRMNWLGGSAKLNTGPDCGTEWELTVPRR